jgi:hypothetical protein
MANPFKRLVSAPRVDHPARLAEAIKSPRAAYLLGAECLSHARGAADHAFTKAGYWGENTELRAAAAWKRADLRQPTPLLRDQLLAFAVYAETRAQRYGASPYRRDIRLANEFEGVARALLGAAGAARIMAAGVDADRTDADEMRELATAALEMSRMATIGATLASGYSRGRGVDTAVSDQADIFERRWQAEWLDARDARLKKKGGTQVPRRRFPEV